MRRYTLLEVAQASESDAGGCAGASLVSDDGWPLVRRKFSELPHLDRSSFDIKAYHRALERGQRIGAARNVFEVPDSIDAHNDEIAERFLGGDEHDDCA
jgi:hypothetical protein